MRNACAIAATMLWALSAAAQNYPSKPVRYIMPTTGASEVVGRLVAQGMSEVLGQQVLVDVRAGAGGNLGAEIAAKAPADGYTLLQITQSHAVNVSLFKSLAYDVLRDFTPITKADLSPLIVVVHPSLPVKTIADLVKIAKAKPGAINYGSAGVGTSTYLAAELFKSTAGINLLEVPYRGGAPAQTAVIAGEVSVYFAPIATALPFVKDRRLRALAQIAPAMEQRHLPVAEPDIVEHGKRGREAELLRDESDAESLRVLRVVDDRRHAVDRDRPGIGRVHAGNDLDQRALACAVLAADRADLAGIDAQADVLQHLVRSEPLRHTLCGEDGHFSTSSLPRICRRCPCRCRTREPTRTSAVSRR